MKILKLISKTFDNNILMAFDLTEQQTQEGFFKKDTWSEIRYLKLKIWV